MKQFLAYTESQSTTVGSSYSIKHADDLGNFQARIYIHPDLRNSKKVNLYTYSSNTVKENLEDEYILKIQEVVELLKN